MTKADILLEARPNAARSRQPLTTQVDSDSTSRIAAGLPSASDRMLVYRRTSESNPTLIHPNQARSLDLASKTRSRKSPSTAKPTPDQLKAVERLIQKGTCDQAAIKAKALVERFPAHSGARRALVAALECAEGAAKAALAAFEWAEARPNSLQAQETLLSYLTLGGLSLLADRVARQVRALGGATPGYPLPAALIERFLQMPDGSRPSVEALEHFDIGKLYLDAQEFDIAERRLDQVDIFAARNNRAIALFHLGRIEEALPAFLAAWEADPDNLLALGWAARLRLYLGDETGAQGLCTPLALATARRADDAIIQVGTLLLFQRDQAASEAFERIGDAEWFGPSLGPVISNAMLLHLGACAACRVGRRDEAERLWQRAAATRNNYPLATANLAALRRPGRTLRRPMMLDLAQALPLTRITKLRSLSAGAEAEAEAAMDALNASTAYLEAYYLSGEETLRSLIRILLKDRVDKGDAEAAACLKGFARLPIGTGKERFDLLYFLRRKGHIAAEEPVECLNEAETECTEVKIINTEVYREPADSDLPDDLLELLNTSIELYHDGELDAAEQRLNKILERLPEHPVALGNLASVRHQQGRREDSRAILRKILATSPDYLFARTNLATMLIRDGNLDEAQELLAFGMDHERLHIDEFFALYGTYAQLHAAKGDQDAAQSFIGQLEAVSETARERERLALIKRAVDPQGFIKEMRNRITALTKGS
ncbi:tetratricopeptide repeat protein [Thiocystis violacea]|uniref:tetratricopeptide repeat protein n=1 Tax=Thiocystis violacea TaxID=13725 RepID=UPI001905F5A8|nr:tetratricopeptide repeat protein [Thiocystis violacea]